MNEKQRRGGCLTDQCGDLFLLLRTRTFPERGVQSLRLGAHGRLHQCQFGEKRSHVAGHQQYLAERCFRAWVLVSPCQESSQKFIQHADRRKRKNEHDIERCVFSLLNLPASAAALAVSGQEKELLPIFEVPTPQKNMAGLSGFQGNQEETTNREAPVQKAGERPDAHFCRERPWFDLQ